MGREKERIERGGGGADDNRCGSISLIRDSTHPLQKIRTNLEWHRLSLLNWRMPQGTFASPRESLAQVGLPNRAIENVVRSPQCYHPERRGIFEVLLNGHFTKTQKIGRHCFHKADDSDDDALSSSPRNAQIDRGASPRPPWYRWQQGDKATKSKNRAKEGEGEEGQTAAAAAAAAEM